MANRADPLTRASFWSAQYSQNATDPNTALEFAQALRGIGSHQRAEEVVRTTLVLHPGHGDLLMLLGRLRMGAGDHAEALERFGQLVRIEPDRAEAWAAMGTALDQLGQHSRAQTAYVTALGIEPGRITTLTNYGLSLLLSGDLAGAEAQLRTAASDPQASALVHENLALVVGLQGRFEEMKTISAAHSPGEVADHNAALLENLIYPGGRDSARDAAATSQAARPEQARTTRRLRGSLN